MFSNTKFDSPAQQRIIPNPIRKHLLVETVFTLRQNSIRQTTRTPQPTRNLDPSKLHQEDILKAKRFSEEGRIDEVLENIVQLMDKAVIYYDPHRRRSKPWFKTDCFNARRTTLEELHTARANPTPDNLLRYAQARRLYKDLLRKRRTEYQEDQDNKKIEEAERLPYKILNPRKPVFSRDIPMEAWETHMRKVLESKDTRPPREQQWTERATNHEPVTTEELKKAIRSAPNGKACGPDHLYNEHLKAALPQLQDAWTSLINECLRRGSIPDGWRGSTVKMLYKGKGKVDDPNAYRGIALECALFKIMTKILTERLTDLTDHHIPEQQFGFRRGRSTLHAVRCLQQDIEEALRLPRRKLHIIFIDFSKAFDTLNRKLLVTKLEHLLGKEHYLTAIVRHTRPQ